MDAARGIKLLLTYDVLAERQQEYYQFVTGRYLPAMQSLGFQMSEAWHTVYGDFPDRLVGFVSDKENAMYDLLSNELWFSLNEELEEFVTGFDYKIVPFRGGFQM